MNRQTRSNQTKSSPEVASLERSSVTSLFRELANDITGLFTKEVALAKTEIRHSINETKKSASTMISGGSILYAGFLFILLSAVLGLAQIVELWLASLIVGGVVGITGFAMVQAGKKKLEPSNLKPKQTMDSLRKDRAAIRGATS